MPHPKKIDTVHIETLEGELCLYDWRRLEVYNLNPTARGHKGQPGCKTPVESLGGQVGVEPLPVGLVVVAEYQPAAVWRPRKLTPGQALLALMDNTVAARRNPAHSTPILKRAVTGAISLKSKRGEAGAEASSLLSQLNQILGISL